VKAKLVEHLLSHPGPAAFIVDEAVTVTDDELGARTLGALVRRGRHFGLDVHVPTQRVTDWFDTRIGRTIQSGAASKFGQIEPRELYEIAPSLGLSPEERDRIEKAGQREGLLVTAGRRVWVNLYGLRRRPNFRDGQHGPGVGRGEEKRPCSSPGRRKGALPRRSAASSAWACCWRSRWRSASAC